MRARPGTVVRCVTPAAAASTRAARRPDAPFKIEEATIADIQKAILSKQVTTTDIVKLYLARIKAYNGTCVNQPEGLLGPISTIAHAGQLNALSTLNLRPATRKAWGFDDHHARSMTDADNDPAMPDALEIAAEQDKEFARTGKLVGPLHGVVVAIKDSTTPSTCARRTAPISRTPTIAAARYDGRGAASEGGRDHPGQSESWAASSRAAPSAARSAMPMTRSARREVELGFRGRRGGQSRDVCHR